MDGSHKSVLYKLHKYVGILYRLRTKLPQKCLQTIYFAFVRPLLLHGIELCANTGPSHLSKLITLNNKILCILQHKPYTTPVKELYVAYKYIANSTITFSAVTVIGS